MDGKKGVAIFSIVFILAFVVLMYIIVSIDSSSSKNTQSVYSSGSTTTSTASSTTTSTGTKSSSTDNSSGTRKTCIACNGSGQVEQWYTNDPAEKPHWETCALCHGKGYYYE